MLTAVIMIQGGDGANKKTGGLHKIITVPKMFLHYRSIFTQPHCLAYFFITTTAWTHLNNLNKCLHINYEVCIIYCSNVQWLLISSPLFCLQFTIWEPFCSLSIRTRWQQHSKECQVYCVCSSNRYWCGRYPTDDSPEKTAWEQRIRRQYVSQYTRNGCSINTPTVLW